MLTDEERKIYEEEKARLVAQEELKHKTMPKGKDTNYGGLVLIGVLLLLIIVCAILSPGKLFPGKTGQQSGPDEMGAWTISQQFVNDALKAPATASYPSYDESFVTDLGGGRFKVDAYVDAQNSFGAKIRSRFTCTVSSSDGTHWHLENINIE